jgi:hypothetical protein
LATLSRRDFIKLIGAGGLGLAIAMSGLDKLPGVRPKLREAYASGLGSWSLGAVTTAVAVHAALLPSGKIFYLAGSGFHNPSRQGPYLARILDLGTGNEKEFSMTKDLFCCGMTNLADGNIMLAGGTELYQNDASSCNGKWHGLNLNTIVDWQSDTLVAAAPMAHGRWYPTCVTLTDGRVITFDGSDEYGTENQLVEVYDPTVNAWSINYDPGSNATYCVGSVDAGLCAGAGSPCYGGQASGVAPKIGLYPRMHLLPTGKISTCGMHTSILIYDPSTRRWSPGGAAAKTMSTYRHYGASFLLPLQNSLDVKGQILVAGGSPTTSATSFATNSAEIIDFDSSTTDSPIIRQTTPMQEGRKYSTLTTLPDGKCVVFGGSKQGTTSYVYSPEMFDPVTETWQSLTPCTVPRGYHSVAILLSDGRIWTAGNTPNTTIREFRTEIFSPWYVSESRPTITSVPNVGDYGGTDNNKIT